MLSTLLVGTIVIGSIPLLIFFVKRSRQRRTLTRDLLHRFGAMRTLRDRVVASKNQYPSLALDAERRPLIYLLNKIGRDVLTDRVDEQVLFSHIGNEYGWLAEILEDTIKRVALAGGPGRLRHRGEQELMERWHSVPKREQDEWRDFWCIAALWKKWRKKAK